MVSVESQFAKVTHSLKRMQHVKHAQNTNLLKKKDHVKFQPVKLKRKLPLKDYVRFVNHTLRSQMTKKNVSSQNVQHWIGRFNLMEPALTHQLRSKKSRILKMDMLHRSLKKMKHTQHRSSKKIMKLRKEELTVNEEWLKKTHNMNKILMTKIQKFRALKMKMKEN